jgi:hypothetical protein
LQRHRVEVASFPWEVIMAQGFGHLLGRPDGTAVEVHHTPIWHRVRKDHTTPTPIPCGMRPGARCGIAHAQLLSQRQGNAALPQVGFAATAGQGGLKSGEVLGERRLF